MSILESFDIQSALDKQALNKFIDQQITEGDAAAIITSTGSLGVLEQFTRNKQILHLAVSRLSPGPVVSDSMFTPYLAAMIDHNDPTAINVGIDISNWKNTSHQRPENPGRSDPGKARDILDFAGYRRVATLDTLRALADRMSELKGQRIITVVSDGFTMRDRSSGADTSGLDSTISRAVRSGVVIYTIDAKGLVPPAGFSGINSGPSVRKTRQRFPVICPRRKAMHRTAECSGARYRGNRVSQQQ